MEKVITEYGLEFDSFKEGAGRVKGIWDEINTSAKEFGSNKAFDQQAVYLNKFNNQLASGGKLFEQLGKGPKGVQDELKRLSAEYVKLVTSQDRAMQSGNWKQTEADIKRVEGRIAELNRLLEHTPDEMGKGEKAASKFGDALKTAFTVTGVLALVGILVDFGKKLIDITGIGQTYENQFTRIFEGNQEAAKGYLATLQQVADTTNFSFQTLTDNSAKLASRGIIPTQKELLGLGDVANFISKDFGQLNEAILDANNPERWKELGFTVTTQGSKMTLAYGDFSKTVDKSVEGAYEAVQAFSELKKVQGSTVEAGKSLSGQVSTLGDTFAGLFRTIGQGNTGVLVKVVSTLNDIVVFGVGLVKTLQPAFGSLFDVFGKLFTSVGGIFEQFGKLAQSGNTVATTGQMIGYYFTKYVIDPFTIVIGLAATVIEAFNLVIIGSRLAAAKLSGDSGLASTLGKELDATKVRLNGLRDDIKTTFGQMRQGMDAYVNADNARQRRADRRSRLSTDAYSNFTPTPTKPGSTVDPAAQKAAEQLATGLAKEREKMLEERKKLGEQLVALQEKYDKERLETLDKNSDEYIALKRKKDLAEIAEERQKLIELGQHATGTAFYNTKTKTFDVKPNLNYQLPQASENLFQQRTAVINNQADIAGYRAAEEKYDKERAKVRKEFTDAEAQYDRDQAVKRGKLADQSAELELAMRQAVLDKDAELTRKAGESEEDYEKRKNEALLKLRLDYYKQLLKLAEQDPTKKADVLGLEETIAGLEKDLGAVKSKLSTGPKDLYDLLGIRFSKDDNKNKEIKAAVNDATKTVLDGANQILSQQVASDQQRIDSIDAQLAAKQQQVNTEAQLAAAGLANDLETRKKEQAALEADRKKALDAQRRDQAAQLVLNAILQESELALAVAKTIKNAADFPPPFGLILAGIQVAAMLALMGSTIGQIESLPKYHDGDEITPETAQKRVTTGNKRSNEIDIRAEVGEFMVRKESAQPNMEMLKRVNKLGRVARMSDLADLFDREGFGNLMVSPERMKADMVMINQAAENRNYSDRGVHARLDALGEKVERLIDKTGRGSKTTVLPDGRMRIEDEKGNVKIVRHT